MTKNTKSKKPAFEDGMSDDGSISMPCSEGKSLEQRGKRQSREHESPAALRDMCATKSMCVSMRGMGI